MQISPLFAMDTRAAVQGTCTISRGLHPLTAPTYGGERGFGLWPASALERADVLIHWNKQSQLQLCLGIGRGELCLGFCPNKRIK